MRTILIALTMAAIVAYMATSSISGIVEAANANNAAKLAYIDTL